MQQSLQILAPVQVGRRLYGHLRAEYQPGSGDGPKMFLQRRLGMVRHPGVRLGPEILDNHFLDMTIAAMQIADRHQRLDPFLSRLSNANQQAGRERHLCPARRSEEPTSELQSLMR